MDDVKDDKSNVSVSSEPAEKNNANESADKIEGQSDENSSADVQAAGTNNDYSYGDDNKSAETESKSVPAKETQVAAPVEKPESAPQAPAPAAQSATPTRIVVTTDEKENELIALNGLLLVALAGGMFYVGTVLFAADSLLFFAGIFIYLLIAPPGTYVKGKSKMATFTKEVAVAFGLSFVLYLVFKAIPFATDDQAKFLILILFILGFKLVFNPYYNFKQDDD